MTILLLLSPTIVLLLPNWCYSHDAWCHHPHSIVEAPPCSRCRYYFFVVACIYLGSCCLLVHYCLQSQLTLCHRHHPAPPPPSRRRRRRPATIFCHVNTFIALPPMPRGDDVVTSCSFVTLPLVAYLLPIHLPPLVVPVTVACYCRCHHFLTFAIHYPFPTIIRLLTSLLLCHY